ncbi:hypothetical protein Scep_009079 [Stephania cephalantha]|uniref:Potassium transporter n=1 Tax=Stephania cephalantha TaxID=152367 RepID=A0AAP0JTW9_9MAGN
MSSAENHNNIDIAEEEEEEQQQPPPTQLLQQHEQTLKGIKKQRFESSAFEFAESEGSKLHPSNSESIGVVYGDVGTSPLYVYSSTFTHGIKHSDDILGVLSLIFYTLTLIPLVKYVFIVLQANDNGDGGTFALYSLICRYAKVSLIPNQQVEDQDVSNYQLQLPSNRLLRASKLKSKLEKSVFAKYFLLFATMLGTSMVIGDGVLTPCISDRIVWVSAAIIVCLFLVQRFGTDKVGYTFAPIICIWFAMIAGIGLFNFIKYDPTVVKAINPYYIVDYFKRNKKEAWISLGGVVLAITGTEALFADVGHFTVKSIQISMCTITYPSLIMAYTGQASYLRKYPENVPKAFYMSIPHGIYWPMFAVAVMAAIIASQAMISGVTLGFKTTTKIGNAYGIAVVFVMTLTSMLLVLIMVMIWKSSILLVITYILVIGTVELVYLSSVLYKFDEGGYLPLAFTTVLVTVMYVWNYVYRKKYTYELDHKISPDKLKEIAADTNFCRLPGFAIFYSELVHGIPPIFQHYVENVPALHSILVFVSIKSLPISKVPMEERFLFKRFEPKELNVFRCIVRYGYTDVHNEKESFETMLVERLKEYIAEEVWIMMSPTKHTTNDSAIENAEDETENNICKNEEEGEVRSHDEERKNAVEKEVETVEKRWREGVVHLLGESEVVAGEGANLGKKIVINYAYNLLRRNLRQSEKVFEVPHKRLVKVGMTYEL